MGGVVVMHGADGRGIMFDVGLRWVLCGNEEGDEAEGKRRNWGSERGNGKWEGCGFVWCRQKEKEKKRGRWRVEREKGIERKEGKERKERKKRKNIDFG
jgi:hypothetical protein